MVSLILGEYGGAYFEAVSEVLELGPLLRDLQLLLPQLGLDVLRGDRPMKILPTRLDVHLQVRDYTRTLLDVCTHILEVKQELTVIVVIPAFV